MVTLKPKAENSGPVAATEEKKGWVISKSLNEKSGFVMCGDNTLTNWENDTQPVKVIRDLVEAHNASIRALSERLVVAQKALEEIRSLAWAATSPNLRNPKGLCCGIHKAAVAALQALEEERIVL